MRVRMLSFGSDINVCCNESVSNVLLLDICPNLFAHSILMKRIVA